MEKGIYHDILTVGALKELLKDVPDDLPLVRQTDGYLKVLRQGMAMIWYSPTKEWEANDKGFNEVIEFSPSYK